MRILTCKKKLHNLVDWKASIKFEVWCKNKLLFFIFIFSRENCLVFCYFSAKLFLINQCIVWNCLRPSYFQTLGTDLLFLVPENDTTVFLVNQNFNFYIYRYIFCKSWSKYYFIQYDSNLLKNWVMNLIRHTHKTTFYIIIIN